MKKILFSLAAISIIFINCKETKNNPAESHSEETVSETHHSHTNAEYATIDNSWVNEIKLDNESKWEANSETTEGVAKMMSLLKNREINTVEDYHSLSKELNEVKNFIVTECTMKGPSHDNLHVFLHPLIEKIETLNKVSNMEEGTLVLEKIRENLEKYYTYFQ